MDNKHFEKLREQLTGHYTWPSVYMFKFIAPADNRIFAMLNDIFPAPAEVSSRHSAGGRYMSVTVKEMMLSADEVIERYHKVSLIEGIRAL